MADEIELKFMDIDKKAIIRRLKEIGAIKEFEGEMQSITFLKDGFARGDSSKKYLRIRKIGEECFLTYKGPAKDSKLHIRDEIEIKVSDFDATVKIITALGFSTSPLFKKRRMHHTLGKSHIEIDELEGIPAYLEIEAESEKKMGELCALLGLDMSEGKNKTIVEIYPEKFNLI